MALVERKTDNTKNLRFFTLSTETYMKIDSFRGDFRFLSNFWKSPFIHEGILYPTNEHFYQAQKSEDLNERKKIAAVSTPALAKKMGREIKVRNDWDSIKIEIMREGLKMKFAKNSNLAGMLLATYPAELAEVNYWNDTFWGISNKTGQGENWLGKLLMERRNELRERKSR